MDEIRNQLIYIDRIYRKDNDKNNTDRSLDYSLLLERFKIDIERRIEDLEHERKRLEENKKLLEEITKRNNLKI